MRIGIGLPLRDRGGPPLDQSGLGLRARWIEDGGFDGVWIGDASFRRRTCWPDPLMWLLSAAVATRRVELGTAVYQVPLRNPVGLARQFLTLGALATDRFSIGVGPGSTELGFDAVDAPFAERFATLRRSMDIIRRLCAGEPTGNADLAPWPSVRGQPRFLLGAWHGSANLARAVHDYDGWLCSAGHTTVATMKQSIGRYRDLGGTRAIVASCSADLTVAGTPLRDEGPFNLRCPPAEAADRLAFVASLGFDDILINIRDTRSANPFDSDFTPEQLAEVRELLPPRDRRPTGADADSG